MRPRRYELLLLLAAAALLAWRLMIPPYAALANNGDFPKVSGLYSLAPERGGWSDNFLHVTGVYLRAPGQFWNSGLVSSEQALAGAAVAVSHLFLQGDRFDIRWMGLVHVIIWLTAFWAALLAARGLGPARATLLGALCLFVLADISYLAYFNSFYTDTAALLGLQLLAAAACLLLAGRGTAGAILFIAGALLFVTSKAQHAVFALLPAAAAWILFDRLRLAAALLILLAGAAVIAATPPGYGAQAVYNLVFFKLAATAGLEELGLDQSYRAQVGTHSFMPGAPVADAAWLAGFRRRTGYGTIAAYYLRHPRTTLRFLYEGLSLESFQNRPLNLSNFRREDARPPGALMNRFDAWSTARSRLFVWWPPHVLLWYGAMAAACVRIWRRSSNARLRKAAHLGLLLLALGAGEFALAMLADCLETYRHLLLFHLATDLSLCLAAGTLVLAKTSPEKSAGP